MKAIIGKNDLSIVPRWTNNVKDEWIEPIILQACQTGFRDTISEDMYAAIAAEVQGIIAGTDGAEWSDSATYAAGKYVVYLDIFYKSNASVAAGEDTPDANAKWEASELITFWNNYIREYLAYFAYKTFLVWHGKHVAPGGIRKLNEPSSFEVSGEELAYILGDARSASNTKLARMIRQLTEANYEFDGTTYTTTQSGPPNRSGFQIFAV